MSIGAFEGRFDALWDLPLRSGRARLEIPVDVRGAELSEPGVTRNISLDGAFVDTRRLLPVGERVTLRLFVPGFGVPFVVKAEVRWLRSVNDADPHQQIAGALRRMARNPQVERLVDAPVDVGELNLTVIHRRGQRHGRTLRGGCAWLKPPPRGVALRRARGVVLSEGSASKADVAHQVSEAVGREGRWWREASTGPRVAISARHAAPSSFRPGWLGCRFR